MKKTFITIVAVILCVGYGVLSWDIVTHSQEPGPDDSKYAQCDNNKCCVAFNGALDAAKTDWQNNLEKLTDQEKPASEMVDEGYESLRTYNCWVEYICRAVEYSGHAPIESAGTGLRSEHLGIVPGCQAPQDLRMESEYNTVMKALREVPVVGLTVDAIDKAFVDNKINYFPQCQTGGANNASPSIFVAKSNYDGCKMALEKQFGCTTTTAKAKENNGVCPATSNAFVTLENILKKSHADQKASALEKKLGTLIPKLHAMETHVTYLSNFLTNLDNRFACYAEQCD